MKPAAPASPASLRITKVDRVRRVRKLMIDLVWSKRGKETNDGSGVE